VEREGSVPLISSSGRRCEDVVAWPRDAEAREALAAYVDSLATAQDPKPSLGGDLLDFRGADLSGLDLSYAYLLGANLAGVSLVETNLVKATLIGADLRLANLTKADLYKAEANECIADGAVFRDAKLLGARFNRASLIECDLRGAELNSARLRGATLARADLRRAKVPDARFGDDEMPTAIEGARMFGCDPLGAAGAVIGPVDVGEDEPALVDGDELLAWFAAHGAPNVTLGARNAAG
jgi:uncharacterized protein YjbI with pentapeptide repeats